MNDPAAVIDAVCDLFKWWAAGEKHAGDFHQALRRVFIRLDEFSPEQHAAAFKEGFGLSLQEMGDPLTLHVADEMNTEDKFG